MNSEADFLRKASAWGALGYSHRSWVFSKDCKNLYSLAGTFIFDDESVCCWV